MGSRYNKARKLLPSWGNGAIIGGSVGGSIAVYFVVVKLKRDPGDDLR